MKTFYTITDAVTEHTNSRSRRFESYEDAVQAATERIQSAQFNSANGVIILKSVKLVRPAKAPVVEESME